MTNTVLQIVKRLGLEPHPEGGYFREVYRSAISVDHPGIPPGHAAARCGGSLIYFLLEAGDFSAFLRVKWTDEVWHFYAGGAVELHTIDASGHHRSVMIHDDITAAEPATVVPAGCWQAARLADDSPWALCGCTVAPGFEFADFEMPMRAQLLEQFPQHAEIVQALTRR